MIIWPYYHNIAIWQYGHMTLINEKYQTWLSSTWIQLIKSAFLFSLTNLYFWCWLYSCNTSISWIEGIFITPPNLLAIIKLERTKCVRKNVVLASADVVATKLDIILLSFSSFFPRTFLPEGNLLYSKINLIQIWILL